jgi:hypothetical protein
MEIHKMTGSCCEERYDELIDYADGEVAGSAARELETHLETCVPCREALSEIRSIFDFAAAEALLPSETYFESLNERIMSRIRSGEADPWWVRARRWFGVSVWRPVGAMAPVAAVLALALFFGFRMTATKFLSDDEITQIARQMRFYAPMRQLQIPPASQAAEAREVESVLADADEGLHSIPFGSPADNLTILGALEEAHTVNGLSTGFTTILAGSEISPGEVNDLTDRIDEAVDSWNI